MSLHHEAPLQSHTPSRVALSALRASYLYFFRLSFLLLLATAEVCGQNNDITNDEDVIRIRTDLITVPVLVTDPRGRRVSGLTREDFAVRDDGRSVMLEYFATGAERVSLTFALDISGSVRHHLRQQQETALALFSRFGRGSHVAVLHFGEKANFTVPFTADANLAQSSFLFNGPISRRTALFDAAAAAVSAYAARLSHPAERRIVILISDGLDTASATNASTVIGQAQLRGVSIYVIHFPIFAPRDGRLEVRRPSKGFRELAEQTGGQYFMVGTREMALNPRATYDLSPVFRVIEEDLQSQYVLGYYPGEAALDGRFHRIAVGLTSRNNRKLRVRPLREGYILRRQESGARSREPE